MLAKTFTANVLPIEQRKLSKEQRNQQALISDLKSVLSVRSKRMHTLLTGDSESPHPEAGDFNPYSPLNPTTTHLPVVSVSTL